MPPLGREFLREETQFDCRYKDVSQRFPFALRRDRCRQGGEGMEIKKEKKIIKIVAIARQESLNLPDVAWNSALCLRFNNVERKILLIQRISASKRVAATLSF